MNFRSLHWESTEFHNVIITITILETTKTHYEFLVFVLGNHRIPQRDYYDNHPGNYKKPIMNLNGLQMGNDKIPKCD